MIPKRILALTLFAALAVMPPCALRAQWVQANGPNGGNIGAITVCGTNIYAQGGRCIFLSTDTGSTWIPFSISGNVVRNIAGYGAYLLAETIDSFYSSRDYGATWSEASGLIDSNESSVSYLVESGSSLFAVVGDIFRSTDSGFTWSWVNYGYSSGLAVIGSVIFEATTVGIFRSSDDGTTWTPPKDTIDVYSLASIGTILFASTDDYHVLRSTDSGVSWISTGLYAYVPDLSVEGTNIYAAGSYVSKDSGNSWISIHLGNSEANSIAALGETIFVGTFGGFFRSTDGGLNGDLVGLPCVQTVNLFGSGNNLLVYDAAYFGMLDISTDEGISWKHPDNWTQAAQEYCLFDSTIFLDWGGSNDSGFSQESTDHGLTWISSTLPETTNGLVRMGKYLFASTASFTPEETDTDVFRSADEGKTWSVVCTKIQPQVYGWLIPLTGNRLLYGGSSDDEHFAAYLSDDFGESWQYVDSTTLTSSYTAYIPFGLCCHVPTAVTQIGTILIGIDSGELYSTTDDGSNWELVDFTTSNDSLTGINSAAATGNNLFVCAQSGNIFLSTDTGATWKNVNGGLVDSSISFLAITGQYIFAANANDSFWRRPLSDFGIAAVTPVNPLQNSLKSYPNPLSQSTSITFTLPEASEVTLTITDAAGRETPLLRSAWFPAGEHEIAWDASNYPSGVYLCRLSSGGESVTERVVVLK